MCVWLSVRTYSFLGLSLFYFLFFLFLFLFLGAFAHDVQATLLGSLMLRESLRERRLRVCVPELRVLLCSSLLLPGRHGGSGPRSSSLWNCLNLEMFEMKHWKKKKKAQVWSDFQSGWHYC